MISKELLGEVLGIKYSFEIQEYNELSLNNLEWWQNEIYKEQMHTINIYELAHKCKEWALSKKYELVSYPSILWNDYQCVAIDNEGNRTEPFRADTEPEAIFKACTYILNNLSNK